MVLRVSLTVTSRTTDQHVGRLNFVFLDELRAFDCLIEVFRPIHLEDLVLWTDEILRIAMALETPFHLERVNLPGLRHQVDAAVASRTSDALGDMNAVIEINEIGQIVYSRPENGLSRAPALTHRLKKLTGGKKL